MGREYLPSYEHREAGHAEERGEDVAEASLTCSIGDVFKLLAGGFIVGRQLMLNSQPTVMVRMAAAA